MTEVSTEMIEKNIKSSTKYKTLGQYEKVLLWIYYLSQKDVPICLRELINLTEMSEPTVYGQLTELDDLQFIKCNIKIIPKKKRVRDSKWNLKIKFADEGSKTYAERLYQSVTR